jgi:predicted RNase H-like nuclease
LRVAGIDGYKKGWIAVVLKGKTFALAEVFGSFAEVVHGLVGVEFIGVDIPIGLPETGERLADRQAKEVLGSRGNTLFMVPPRRVLEAPDYETAKQHAEPGKKPSRQLWGISRKILEVNDDPGLDDRFFEVHPEMTFFEMAGRKPLPSKKTWDGHWTRHELLGRAGIEIPKNLGKGPGEAGPDDVLDAAAAAWTALRKSRGEAVPLPDPPQDSRGWPTAIWF